MLFCFVLQLYIITVANKIYIKRATNVYTHELLIVNKQ